jgi:hypothetical protein
MYRLKLLDEFINDKTINYGDHTSRNYCQEMWALSDQVYDAFQNPNENTLFLNTPQRKNRQKVMKEWRPVLKKEKNE